MASCRSETSSPSTKSEGANYDEPDDESREVSEVLAGQRLEAFQPAVVAGWVPHNHCAAPPRGPQSGLRVSSRMGSGGYSLSPT